MASCSRLGDKLLSDLQYVLCLERSSYVVVYVFIVKDLNCYGIEQASSSIGDAIEVDPLNFASELSCPWDDDYSAFRAFRELAFFQHICCLVRVVNVDEE